LSEPPGDTCPLGTPVKAEGQVTVGGIGGNFYDQGRPKVTFDPGMSKRWQFLAIYKDVQGGSGFITQWVQTTTSTDQTGQTTLVAGNTVAFFGPGSGYYTPGRY